MSDENTVETPDEQPRRKRVGPLLAGLTLAVTLGGAGFYLTYTGLVPAGGSESGSTTLSGGGSHGGSSQVAFVPIDPILISLPGSQSPRHLRFRAEIETSPADQDSVAEIMPRILDVLNSYLRAVSINDLERPTALIGIRAQILRRVQLVAGDREIRDILVTEFVLN